MKHKGDIIASDFSNTAAVSSRYFAACDPVTWHTSYGSYNPPETEAGVKARHKIVEHITKKGKDKKDAKWYFELAVLKDKEAQEIKEEKERKEEMVCGLIKQDSVLSSIAEAICVMEASQFTPDTKPLKKAYNNRLDEIASVMMKLKK